MNKGSKVKPEKLVYLTRVSQHKDTVMLKLSNKCIQVIYEPEKSGFFYAAQKLYYYENLSALEMKELVISNIAETVNNFIKNSEKSSKIPNIQTYVSVADSQLYVKMPIIKLKHIYGIITELQNKKNKHSRNRNSQ